MQGKRTGDQPEWDLNADMDCPTCKGSGHVRVNRVPTPMSRERLEMILVDVRNGASMSIIGISTEQAEKLLAGEQVTGLDPPGESITGDQRAVWHATELALGVLHPGYVPKREALHDVRRMLAWLDDHDDSWLEKD